MRATDICASVIDEEAVAALRWLGTFWCLALADGDRREAHRDTHRTEVQARRDRMLACVVV